MPGAKEGVQCYSRLSEPREKWFFLIALDAGHSNRVGLCTHTQLDSLSIAAKGWRCLTLYISCRCFYWLPLDRRFDPQGALAALPSHRWDRLLAALIYRTQSVPHWRAINFSQCGDGRVFACEGWILLEGDHRCLSSKRLTLRHLNAIFAMPEWTREADGAGSEVLESGLAIPASQMTFAATILTLYPEMFPGPLGVSLAGRAMAKGKWSCEAVQIRDFATDKHRRSTTRRPAAGRGWC